MAGFLIGLGFGATAIFWAYRNKTDTEEVGDNCLKLDFYHNGRKRTIYVPRNKRFQTSMIGKELFVDTKEGRIQVDQGDIPLMVKPEHLGGEEWIVVDEDNGGEERGTNLEKMI